MKGKRILVVDDEPLIRKLVTDFLKKQGYVTIEADDGKKAMNLFSNEENIDLIILDVMLPEYDGFTVCREIRKKSKVPIIMLTARGEEFDEVFGLDIGADEYISKPFSPNILIARVNAVLRRANSEDKGKELKDFNGLTIDHSAHQVVIDGEVVDLSPKEYELLIYLSENYGKALSREQILDKVWGYDYYGDLRTVDTHINRLRIKLDRKSDYIQTVRGYGYRFEE
ncbi:response regulator [Clostridium beijerinckii]|jgi:Response regulators consisting of a CheY-like receiver domain and a winged-helix DNA-binding domain|uniref:Stage 0 sporulation protein A homolog n=2 Tax=Clostridium beijerinckii TaxID=1520 RepID=A0A1S8PEC7_CLOBE|nr:response regulator transcription factor [Clostridium beijerinckii]ABR33903.1 two component transcriptional regulator, winged helix family [Clostridium beijerinckii NCIMB 8052]AIU03730.1 two component transcriptional regulator [Clostridium beijerinckii ATCC 35702]MBF7811493.1 response regulator transcription factor [Clostridium beijerinckii]NOW92247.1 DNA-binding response OmpR family regulator [Clostridium beijerinckii]NRT24805.1 DNA-binding response OmpR family regulator [Clostridium beijer